MQLICTQSWVPLRAEPASASEMVSSLLFGESCTLLAREADWLRVSCSHDAYEGWIPENYLTNQSADLADWSRKVHVHGAVMQNSGARIDLSPGAIIPSSMECVIDKVLFRYSDARVFEPENIDAAGLSMLFLHSPYLWGGRSVWGIDCSGLVQVVYGMLGRQLPRDASQQVLQGNTISFTEKQTGDIAFFEKNGKVTHVGIVLSDDRIIHASGKVRIDKFTKEGIKHSDNDEITHHLYCIKRV